MVVAYSATGQKEWSSATLANRVVITCAEQCRQAYGSGDQKSFTRPEITDPPVVAVGPDGERLQAPAARERVFWAGDTGSRIVSRAESLGQALSIVSASGAKSVPLAQDATGDALVMIDGDHGAILTHPTRSEAATIFIRRGPSGWRVIGRPQPLSGFDGGCFAVVDGTPAVVTYQEKGAVLVRPGATHRLADSQGAGQCSFTARGPALATYGVNGVDTAISQRDGSGRVVWARTVPGLRELSGRPEHDLLVAVDPSSANLQFLGRTGSVTGTREGVAAKMLDRGLVIVSRNGVPSWRGLP